MRVLLGVLPGCVALKLARRCGFGGYVLGKRERKVRIWGRERVVDDCDRIRSASDVEEERIGLVLSGKRRKCR